MQDVIDTAAAAAGIGFPIMAWLNVVAAGLAIPVAILSIIVLSLRVRKLLRERN